MKTIAPFLLSLLAFLALGSFHPNCFSQTTGAGQATARVAVLSETPQLPSRYPHVIARGEDRRIISSLPIEQRPNRPLHFYGNSVRRMYHGPSSSPFFRFGR